MPLRSITQDKFSVRRITEPFSTRFVQEEYCRFRSCSFSMPLNSVVGSGLKQSLDAQNSSSNSTNGKQRSAQPSWPKYIRIECTKASAKGTASASVTYLTRCFSMPQMLRKSSPTSSPPHCTSRRASEATCCASGAVDVLKAAELCTGACEGAVGSGTAAAGASGAAVDSSCTCRADNGRPGAFPGECAACATLPGDCTPAEAAEVERRSAGVGDSGPCMCREGAPMAGVGAVACGSRGGRSSATCGSSAGGGSRAAALRTIGWVLFGMDWTILEKASLSRCCESEATTWMAAFRTSGSFSSTIFKTTPRSFCDLASVAATWRSRASPSKRIAQAADRLFFEASASKMSGSSFKRGCTSRVCLSIDIMFSLTDTMLWPDLSRTFMARICASRSVNTTSAATSLSRRPPRTSSTSFQTCVLVLKSIHVSHFSTMSSTSTALSICSETCCFQHWSESSCSSILSENMQR
mmetsp:Transcript_56679/g.132158  ORF Transcript_56679/g.132158 Transcript_56679/m.132158 type:complete len:467 (-) Transcript_56679:79-1479(-)